MSYARGGGTWVLKVALCEALCKFLLLAYHFFKFWYVFFVASISFLLNFGTFFRLAERFSPGGG